MIIKGIRLRSSSSIERTIRHLQNGDDNDLVDFINGTSADIQDMHRDAVSAGSKFAVRHWIVAPHEWTTRKQMAEILSYLSREFQFDVSRAVVVEHRKQRSTPDAADVHWHVLVGEVDPISGRILATSYDWVKHELIARLSEFSFGHAFVVGRHTSAVIKGLRKRNLNRVADRLQQCNPSHLRPAEAFTHDQHQGVKRLGLDLPRLRQAIQKSVKNARSREDVAQGLASLGLRVEAGSKPDTWVVCDTQTGAFVGALHRLAGINKSTANVLMQTVPCAMPRMKDRGNCEASADNAFQEPDEIAVPRLSSRIHVDRHLARLAGLEKLATRELAATTPEYRPTPAMQQAKEAREKASTELSRIVMQRSSLHREIHSVPPVRWWSWLTGAAERRQREIQELQGALEGVEAEVRRTEVSITACRRKELIAERAAKASYAELVKAHHLRQENAQELRANIEECRSLLEAYPDKAVEGLDVLLEKARLRRRRRNLLDDQLDNFADGIVGRPEPPHRN